MRNLTEETPNLLFFLVIREEEGTKTNNKVQLRGLRDKFNLNQ